MILYYVVLCYIILYYIIFIYAIILYYIILYYVILSKEVSVGYFRTCVSARCGLGRALQGLLNCTSWVTG